ncbi:hypothetical protein ACRALDRAFT_212911 [Sodiomyces alcalophilus JCM 7366]|uniref:uncharacterized protein n=1 Tax=Sodiomyces alcalophilus JCM 7366 TaxID=591952 RepID=UPI0039B5774B
MTPPLPKTSTPYVTSSASLFPLPDLSSFAAAYRTYILRRSRDKARSSILEAFFCPFAHQFCPQPTLPPAYAITHTDLPIKYLPPPQANPFLFFRNLSLTLPHLLLSPVPNTTYEPTPGIHRHPLGTTMLSERGDEGIKSAANSQAVDMSIHIHTHIGIEAANAETSMPMQTESPKQLKPTTSHNPPTPNDTQASRGTDGSHDERAANLDKAKRQLFASSEDMAAELREIEKRRDRPFKKDAK